ncbi:MAG TPA: hypothetical protein VJ865_02700, partial [Gemmatimonadaceae bacterium]|nr:hypothetical protein [Gemmatimonadaceae bacterium]
MKRLGAKPVMLAVALTLFACAREVVATARGTDAEPEGMTRITEWSLNALGEDGWGLPHPSDADNFTIVGDASAPKSPEQVGAMRFPAGFTGGTSPALTERSLNSEFGTLYVSMYFKLSSNWVGHPTGTNKVLHFWVADLNRVFAYVDGSGKNTLKPYIGLQGIAAPFNDGAGETSTSVNLAPNLPGHTGAEIVRGRWYHWEMLFTVNTPARPTGLLIGGLM